MDDFTSRRINRISWFKAGARRTFSRMAATGRLLIVTALSLIAAEITVAGEVLRTQTIQLQPGWNAVFLEVQPVQAQANAVFRGVPVDTVACFLPGSVNEQYLRSPGDAPWKEEGWAVWHAPSQPDAFLSNLYELHPHRPYLIRATNEFAWKITGSATAAPIAWQPNTCTFTGLPVDGETPPTFNEFFSGSAAHQRLRIFRLEAGNWRLVRDANTARPRSGEAYWIQTDGASSYQGPLRLKSPVQGEIDLDLLGTSSSLDLVNDASSTAQIRIEPIASDDSFPLYWTERDLSARSEQRHLLSQSFSLAPLPLGGAASLRLVLDRTALTSDGASKLLKISDGRGCQFWVPVRARRSLGSGTSQ